MAELEILDKAYHLVIQRFIDTGRAPHYTEMAAELGILPEAGRQLIHDLVESVTPGTWLHPGTDHIASLAPFNNLPTQYRITLEGMQKWFGQ